MGASHEAFLHHEGEPVAGMRWLAHDREEPPDRLDPVRIFTPELELRGFVASTGQRVTDILLRGEDLSFLPIGAPEVAERWIRVSPSEILVVAPPPLARSSTWRPTRHGRPLALRIGEYEARGTALVDPGESTWDLARRQPFLPLTEAELIDPDAGQAEHFEVLIVNLAQAYAPNGVASPSQLAGAPHDQ